jgi:hypothetical protein
MVSIEESEQSEGKEVKLRLSCSRPLPPATYELGLQEATQDLERRLTNTARLPRCAYTPLSTRKSWWEMSGRRETDGMEIGRGRVDGRGRAEREFRRELSCMRAQQLGSDSFVDLALTSSSFHFRRITPEQAP